VTLAALIALVVLWVDLTGRARKLPQNRRQIPREVFNRSLSSAGLQFGFELGTGVRTYLPTASPYLLATLIVLLQPGWYAAIAAGAGFGLGRALMPVLRTWSGDGPKWDVLLQRRLGWAPASISLIGGVLMLNLF
jgi:hypothetical protein